MAHGQVARSTPQRGRAIPARHTAQRSLWLWSGLVALTLIAVTALVGAAGGSGASGALIPERIQHDFGTVRMQDGLLTATFPLEVREAAVITNVDSSCMCTKARVVQGDRTSDWLGMSHEDGVPKPINEALAPNVAASVEVSIDPAAHGEAGVGPFTRVVGLKTAAGEELRFTLRGVVVR